MGGEGGDGNAKTWAIGDRHQCGLRPFEHEAGLDCAEYATRYRDRSYEGGSIMSGPRCLCARETLESEGTTLITDTMEHSYKHCKILSPERRYAGPTLPGQVYGSIKIPDEMLGRSSGSDLINHPPHYTSSPAKCSKCEQPIECIDITRHMMFDPGNVVKYVWRRVFGGKAGEGDVEGLEKAVWYLQDEIKRLRGEG